MFKAVKIILILASLLFLSIQLLFSLSYETFIPWDSGFGGRIYIVYIFFLWIATEQYFYRRIKEKDFDHSLYAMFPLALITVSIIVTWIIFSIFKHPDTGGGHISNTVVFLLTYIIYQSPALLIYGLFRVGAYHGFEPHDESIFIETAKFLNKLLNKLSIIIIPLLIIIITATVTLAFNDYLSGGIKYKFSDKPNNKPMLQFAIKNNDTSFCDKIKGQKYLVGGFWYRDAIELQKGCIHSFIYDIPEIKNANKESSKVDFFHTYKKLEKHCSKTKFQKECTVTLLKSMKEILESNAQDSIKTSDFFVDTTIKVSSIKNGFGDVKGDFSTQYLTVQIKHKTWGYPADDFEFYYPFPGYDYPMYELDVETISDTINAFQKAQVKLKLDLKGIKSVVGIRDSAPKRKKTTFNSVNLMNKNIDIIPGKPTVYNHNTDVNKTRLSTTIYIDIEAITNAKSDFEKIITIASKVFSKQRKQSIPINAYRRKRPCKRTEKSKPRVGISIINGIPVSIINGVPERVDMNFWGRVPNCIDGKIIPRIKNKRFN